MVEELLVVAYDVVVEHGDVASPCRLLGEERGQGRQCPPGQHDAGADRLDGDQGGQQPGTATTPATAAQQASERQ